MSVTLSASGIWWCLLTVVSAALEHQPVQKLLAEMKAGSEKASKPIWR